MRLAQRPSKGLRFARAQREFHRGNAKGCLALRARLRLHSSRAAAGPPHRRGWLISPETRRPPIFTPRRASAVSFERWVPKWGCPGILQHHPRHRGTNTALGATGAVQRVVPGRLGCSAGGYAASRAQLRIEMAGTGILNTAEGGSCGHNLRAPREHPAQRLHRRGQSAPAAQTAGGIASPPRTARSGPELRPLGTPLEGLRRNYLGSSWAKDLLTAQAHRSRLRRFALRRPKPVAWISLTPSGAEVNLTRQRTAIFPTPRASKIIWLATLL